ncbi:MAG TPA: hypothetical protein VNS55_07395 [Nocardioides sp.]|nr:hypothetical protein [Nocardioides sp.]
MTTQGPGGGPSARARAALDRGDFRAALDAVCDVAEDADVLEVRASAAYGAGELELALSSWEHLYAVRLAAGDRAGAAHAAALVALNLLCETALMAPVRGWVGRAQRLVAGQPSGPADALLAVVGAYERFLSGDPAAAAGPAREAVELGDAFGVDPARALGRVALARLAIHDGDLERGVGLLDELAVELGAGVFDPLTTGNAYCELICAAQWIGRHDRAREWTDIMERWRHGPALGSTHGRCRVHRAELLRVSGPGEEAEEEALAACADLRPWMRREYGWPLVELGNIRLRRGDLVGAEEAFVAAHGHAWSPQPGLALLRLAQSDPDTAAAMVRDEIEHPTDVPWKERPPFGDLRLVPLLAAQAEIAAARGDATVAAAAADELAAVRDRYPGELLAAEASLAAARAALLAGDPAAAVRPAAAAVATWVDLGAPYDAAGARVVLGDALAADGRPDAARMEWQAALAAYVGYGAPLKEASVRERLDRDRAVASPVTTSVAELVDCGGHWLLRYAGTEVVLPALRGIGHLARLVGDPGREFPATDLADARTYESPLPVIDEETREAYRRRLADVEEDLAQAEQDHDEARIRLAERDRDYLLAELRGALGLGGRIRGTGGSSERARTAVTRSLRYALARIAEVHPDLGRHLSCTVRTGSGCSYVPDPLAPITWRVT